MNCNISFASVSQEQCRLSERTAGAVTYFEKVAT